LVLGFCTYLEIFNPSQLQHRLTQHGSTHSRNINSIDRVDDFKNDQWGRVSTFNFHFLLMSSVET